MPIKTLNPKNAFNSSTVIFDHLSYFSSPIAIFAYALLSFTILSIRSGEKNRSKTFSEDVLSGAYWEGERMDG